MEFMLNRSECCGCAACVNVCPKQAIKMVVNEEGFEYPELDNFRCIECGQCAMVCPIWGAQTDITINPKVYAMKHRSAEVLLSSSSGGMFTALSDFVLENGGVVYGAVRDKELNTLHIRVDSKDARDKMRGSKYVQSSMGEVHSQIKADLKNGIQVLFSGTPCQVDSVKAFLNNNNTDQSGLLLVDVICYGVPSPGAFKDYVRYCERKKGNRILTHQHRIKDMGWNHTEKVVYANGDGDFRTPLSQAWKKMFYTDNLLRLCCYKCKYSNINRPSDITIGDFWGIERYHPDFFSKLGVSLVLVNSPQGADIFEQIKGRTDWIPSDLDFCLPGQPRLRNVVADPSSRERFWRDYKCQGINYILRKYGGCGFIDTVKYEIKTLLTFLGLKPLIKKIIKRFHVINNNDDCKSIRR